MKSVSQMIAGLYLIVLLVLQLPQSPAQAGESVETRLQAANEAYSQGHYDRAIADYSALIAEHGFSAEILYNLGNSYAQSGRYGLAIVQYLRGLQLSPGDADIQGNLELIRKHTGLFEDEPTLRQRLFILFDLHQWALLALTTLFLFTILMAAHLRYPVKRAVTTGGTFLLLATLTLACIGTYQQYRLLNGGVITAAETRLLLSPFASAASLGTMPEGTIVFSEKQHGEYYFVNDTRGRSGWIPAASLETIKTARLTYSPTGAGQ